MVLGLLHQGCAEVTEQLWPFFCFYGGKWRVGRRYDAPVHDEIIEPFAGSAGYSMRYPHLAVSLYDADPVIVGLWKYLIGVSEKEVLALPRTVEHIDRVAVCEEARWLIGFWLNKGMTAPCKTPSKWMRDGWRPNSQWGPVIRQRIASQLEAIRHWKVEQRSYEDVPQRPATWFVDPPYNNRVGRRYRFHELDYGALGAWCRSLPGQVTVCEQSGALWLPFSPFMDIKTTEGPRRTNRSSEVVWTNGENARPSLFEATA